MEFGKWEPIYETIVADFGYDPAADRRARDELDTLVTPFDLDRLVFTGKTVAIAGGSDDLTKDLEQVHTADRVIAVSSASKTLDNAGIQPDLVVTDLDGSPETARELSQSGVPIAVHAHGDNRELVRTLVPTFEEANVLGTTQVEPTERVRNFGGFTDGDRAAFLVDHLGAETLTFPGWDLHDRSVSSTKAHKLVWAGRLLRCLEIRRSEQFPLLNGLREDIDTTTPIDRTRCSDP